MQLKASRSGLPVAFVIRNILSMENEEQILNFVQNVPHASGQNYIIGIRGKVYDFEASAGQVVRFDPGLANGAVYHAPDVWVHVHDAKLDALEDLLEELNGHPVLLLYEFRHDRERILARFPDAVDLKSSDIAQTVDLFNRGDIRLLIGHPGSMGHGLNLQGTCNHIIWFGITWNLEHYDQAVARVYRQGQKNEKVLVYHITAKDTLDEKVMRVLTDKDHDQQKLLMALK